MSNRLNAFDNFTNQQIDMIENDLNLSGHQKKDLEKELEKHKLFVSKINHQVSNLLELKLKGFEILLHLSNRDEIDVFLINGVLLINNTEPNC